MCNYIIIFALRYVVLAATYSQSSHQESKKRLGTNKFVLTNSHIQEVNFLKHL